MLLSDIISKCKNRRLCDYLYVAAALRKKDTSILSQSHDRKMVLVDKNRTSGLPFLAIGGLSCGFHVKSGGFHEKPQFSWNPET